MVFSPTVEGYRRYGSTVNVSVEQLVTRVEDALVAAMVAGDAAAVAALTADNVVFTAPGGATIGKAEDLDTYRVGALRITEVRVLRRQVAAFNGTGQSKMLAQVAVEVGDDRSEVTLEWVRHWELRDGAWLLVAATTAVVRR
jgi:hypothetical protein